MAGLLFATSLEIYGKNSRLLMVSIYTLPLIQNYAQIEQDSECENATRICVCPN
jgi:hypothetical protein